MKNLDLIVWNSVTIDASDRVRLLARKLLRRYPLRAADSLQLAATCLLAGEAALPFSELPIITNST